jgi:putative heme-binding domain-containing protein
VLAELQQQRLTARQLGAAALENLTARSSGEVQRQLQSVYEELVNSDRQQVVNQYLDCLQLEADPLRGRHVFKTQCGSCHRIGETGIAVGPDISDSRTQQPLQLLTSILNPNLAIDNNYFRYVILTVDDQIIEGMVAEETADAIVIRGPENRRTVVGRHEVAELKATGVSMMPEGLETQIDQQAMADLIAFIKGWRYLDGAVPGK